MPEIGEIWKDIKGWEGIYQISDRGNLKSFKRHQEGRVLSNVNKTGGYFSVVLQWRSRKRCSMRIHRLVAEAFIPNPAGKPQVNHKDGNKQNNSAYNLEWVTCKENMYDAIRNGVDFYSAMNYYNTRVRPKRILQISLMGEIVNEHINGQEASKATKICRRNILQVANKDEYKLGKTRKQAGGFIWRFA